MPSYGGYETTGRIFSIGARSVYAARAEGGKKDEFVVKVLAGDDVFGEDPEAAKKAFATRAKLHKQLTDAKAKAWVRTHAMGVQGDEVFYVTDRVPNSAQQLIAGKVRLDHADLSRVVGRVLEGLRELRSACGRAHENLKPTNVLIESGGNIATAKVVLTDPSGREHAGREKPGGASGEHADAKAIGELIHLLVLHAPFRALGGYPIEDSPAWGRLGKTGQQWRALCNRLLDPSAKAGDLSVESVAGEVGTFAAKGGGGLPKPLIIGGVAVLLLAAGGAVVAWPTIQGMMRGGEPPEPPPDAFDQAAWDSWTDKALWADAVRRALRSGSLREVVERDSSLSSSLLLLIDEEIELDPRRVFSSLRREPTVAGLDAPAEARTPESVQTTRDVVEWIERVEQVVAPESWPTAGLVDRASARFAELRWGKFEVFAADIKQRLADRTDPDAFARGLREAIEARDSLVALVGATDAIDFGTRAAPTVEVEFGNVYTDNLFLDAPVEPRDMDAFAAYLRENRERINQTVIASNTTNTNPGTQNQTPNGTNGNGENQTPSGNNTANGQNTNPPPDGDPTNNNQTNPPAVDIGPDPRESWTGATRLAELRHRLDEPWTGDARGEQIRADLRGVRGELDSLDAAAASIGVDVMPWEQGNIEQVRATIASIDAGLGGLSQRLDGVRIAYAAEVEARGQAEAQTAFDQARRALEGRALTEVSSPTLRARWDQGRTAILAQFTQATDLSEMGAAASRLEQRINDARAAIPMAPSDIPAPPGADAAAIRDALTAEREAALASAWDAGEGEAFQAAIAEQGQRIQALYQATRAAGADLSLGVGAIGAGVGWREPIPGATAGQTLESLAESWAAAESALAASVAEALRPSARPLGDLDNAIAQVERIGDPADLGAVVLDDQAAIQARLAAWDRLPQGSFLAIDAESQMLQSLRTAAGAMTDQSRRDALVARLNQRATALWASRMDAARTRQELAAARDLAGTLGIGFDGTALSPRVRFNIGLNTAIERAEQVAQNAAASDDEHRRALQSILDVANRAENQALWAGDQAMAAWIASIQQAAAAPTGGGDLASVGPGSVGWRYQNTDPSGQRATYVSPGGVTLEFARVDLPTGQSAFLQTTEVSADAFGRAADQGGFWNELEAQWSGSAADVINGTDWPGPAVWSYDRNQPGRLSPNSIWLRAQRPSGPTRAVANAFPPGFAERPSLDMPMQQVTASAARLFAQRLGCRLPTVSEWRAAAQREPTSGWNVRDQVWLNQRNHAANNQRQTPAVPYPDEGAFAENFDVPAETGSSATPVTSASDGTLYFQPVTAGPGATFKNIIGNVWEFVRDSQNNRIYVVGQSSLSPPEWGTNPIEVPDYLERESRYPDVGFRLAFDAPPPSAGAEPLRDRARAILQNAVLAAPNP
ncbi:MAG: hypothetical protein R3B68_10245 [Phycisphaerales bacterium]